jgi:hypothetical protein
MRRKYAVLMLLAVLAVLYLLYFAHLHLIARTTPRASTT